MGCNPKRGGCSLQSSLMQTAAGRNQTKYGRLQPVTDEIKAEVQSPIIGNWEI
jgi:hypothetical protein